MFRFVVAGLVWHCRYQVFLLLLLAQIAIAKHRYSISKVEKKNIMYRGTDSNYIR